MKAQCALSLFSIAIVAACEAQPDSVGPGYYGELQMAGAPMRPMSGSAARPNTSSATKPPSSTGATPPLAAGSAPMQTTSGVSQAGSAAAAAGSGANTMTPPVQGAGGDCDLTGRWILTYHLVADALGEPQYTHYYHYYEIEQQGDALTVTRGMRCDADSIGVGAFAATSSFAGARDAIAARVNYSGRKGSSVPDAGGCKVDFEKWYVVTGATVPYYLDPSTPLPTAEEMASGDTPGWEDWDEDGSPGVTGMVSGIVTGKIFVAPRMWTSFGGVVDVSSAFQMTAEWGSEQNVMAYDGTPLLGSEAVRAADPSLHFTQMARLSPDQATGDDKAICSSILDLAPVLTPEAAGN